MNSEFYENKLIFYHNKMGNDDLHNIYECPKRYGENHMFGESYSTISAQCLAIIFILSFSPDLAEGGKSPVSVARGGEMLGMSVWCQSPLTAHRLVPGSGWADWAPNTGHRARARSSSSDSGSVLGGGSARHQHHKRIE